MTTRLWTALVLLCAAGFASAVATAQQRSGDGPTYSATRELIRPADYREWVYLTSGLGMTYGPAGAANGAPPRFDNVFVNRESYRSFVATGRWPEKTMFILEVRESAKNVSINNGGQTQGPIVAVESAVKDSERFPGTTWAYFSFDGADGLRDTAAPLPATASCYSCHANNTAVENTFVQFYPTLMDVARRMGTLKPTYDPQRKP
jgi:hypothetical protein